MSKNKEVMMSDFIENRADDIEDAELFDGGVLSNHSQPYKDMALALQDCQHELRAAKVELYTTVTELARNTVALELSTWLTNPVSGNRALCSPIMVAVHDALKEAEYCLTSRVVREEMSSKEMAQHEETFDIGLHWFMENHPKEYMVLLD